MFDWNSRNGTIFKTNIKKGKIVVEFKIEENKNIKVFYRNDTEVLAKATCYFKGTPKVDKQSIGTIGEFEACNKVCGVKILNKCEEILKEKGVKLIVSPMNGNTWKQYRTIKFSNGEPLFMLENVNPIEYNEILKEAGFHEMYTYISTKGFISNFYESDTFNEIEQNLINEKITIREFDKENYYQELKKIYKVAIKSFLKNPLYTSIEETNFIKQYTQYIQMIDKELILIAEKEGQEIGFIFCIPDFNEVKQTGKITTLILKTIAVLPEYEEYAIGSVMLRRISQIALKKGFKKWIFAFMYHGNTSLKMAQRNQTKKIREYALYGKEIR